MPNGQYRVLTETIENPNADRRVKHDWRAWPAIPAGTRFLHRTCDTMVAGVPVPVEELVPSGPSATFPLTRAHGAALFAAVLAHSTPVDQDVREMLSAQYLAPLAMLEYLVAEGIVTITPAMVDAALAWDDARQPNRV